MMRALTLRTATILTYINETVLRVKIDSIKLPLITLSNINTTEI